MISVGVLGASGRMGATVCQAVTDDPELVLVGAADAHGAGDSVDIDGVDLTVLGTVEELIATGPDVVVDFTVAPAARENLPKLAAAGIHAVVGTTGFSDDDLASLEAGFSSSNCLLVANFAISAVLMMKFAEMAAPFFQTAEIVEYHHMNKADAPSGTAMVTAERMAAASAEWDADPTTSEVAPGARGGEGPSGIRMHAIRMEGMVAHQEVIMGASGQLLTIRQDSFDRVSFMPGVVLAVKHVGSLPGLTQGLEPVLGI